MEPNVERKAKELADAIVASEAYQKLQEAREEIEEHQAAQIMLRDLMTKQQRLQEKIMRGEQPSEADVADYEQTAQIVTVNPYVRRLLEAEMRFSEMMMAVQQELAQAVGLELPQGPEVEQVPESPPPPESPTRSKLWVPGRDG